MTVVGFLHPGQMGVTLAAACAGADESIWVDADRSEATRTRAEQASLRAVGSLHAFAERCDVIVSICPPHAAVDVADQVHAAGFAGLYCDANAISPAASRSIARRFEHFVDGSVIGPPAHSAGTTRLYLSGDRAPELAALWVDGVLDARVIDGGVGAASALKMSYASWTKIGAALQLAIRALAANEGVDQALVDEWEISQIGLVERTERAASAVSPKAWRFGGEMRQISDSFEVAGLPTGFADAAADIYDRMADLRTVDDAGLAQVIDRLT